MIRTADEYIKAREELQQLNAWLDRLELESASNKKSFTQSSVRMMIARVQQEVAAYEMQNASHPSHSFEPDPNAGIDCEPPRDELK